MLKRQSGKALPFLLIGAVALAAGIFVFSQTQSDGDTGNAVSSGDSEQLVALQETLKTSLALPLDFRTVPEFELQDVNGEPITQAALEDKWSLMFFGFTHCPDVCPITLQLMKTVVSQLEEQGKEAPQIVFVSVDPVRDTSEVMKEYIAYFDESFIGITGDLNKVHEMTSSLGIVASFTVDKDDSAEYTVDHTASLLLIDPQRRLRAKVSPPLDVQNIISDYLAITSAPS
ncbi:SCO family protein [Granulosicoccus antarcticus]|uniref:Thioredoxin domain-containing protein n=1 Tax=Granulosicoccus antarcticus IMCC3135 TaxID=1192854 RepID=A0A2Z2NVH4_9GAMM|nr:SCO family protein [Granulosicoccus antarcticus]ASJ75243.1 hypothetical protein IMCC3135_25940 [Granulosicoccus antarcticus IMCC3135]